MVVIGLLAAAWAGTLSGTVSGEDGTPVPNADVYAINPGLQAAKTSTTSTGAYRFEGLPTGNYRVWVIPESSDLRVARYYPGASTYCDGTLLLINSNPIVADITLPSGDALSGLVTDASGTPIDNVRIRAESISGAAPRDCLTNTEGEFNLVGLEPHTQWKLQAAKTGLPVQWWGATYDQTEALDVDPSSSPTVPDWTVLEGISVAGQISGPDGPVHDAKVRVYSSRQLIQTTTDENGVFASTGLPPGEVTAWATADGLATTYLPDSDRPTNSIQSLEEGGAVEDLDIRMPTESIFGLTLNGAAPLTNGDLSGVSAMLYNDSHTVGLAATSDEQGYIEWTALHEGQYEVLVYGGNAGHPDDWLRTPDGTVRTFNVAPPNEQVDESIQLPLAVTLRGEVVDENGNAIPSAMVVVSPGMIEDTGMNNQSDALFIETTDALGAFSLVGIPEGHWEIRAQTAPNCDTDPGYVTSYWPAEEDPSMAESFEVNLDNPVENFRFTLAIDDDHDQMGDRWERRYKLDTAYDDSGEDPDNDGLTNLLEFRLRTNPLEPEGYWTVTRTCGCASATRYGTLAWLPLILLAISRRRA